MRRINPGPRSLAILWGAVFLAFPIGATGPSTPVSRVVVWKKVNTVSPGESFFLPVTSAKPAAAGYTMFADYASRTLFRGPKSAASQVVTDLESEGFDVQLATDLDSIGYHDYTIDADTGTATPLPPSVAYTASGSEGLYFVTLEGYPTEAWLADLAGRNVRIVEGLAPASYIARGPRSVMTSLPASTGYVRGVFPLLPALKKALFNGAGPLGAFQWVSIEASEESPADSILPFLNSVSAEPAVETWREPGKVRYEALLSDLDISTLITFENVYEVSPTRGAVSLSAERPAVLITRTDAQAGTLPTTSPDYISYLTSHGIAWNANPFDNTIIGMVDTGFDNGDISFAGIQPDFKFTSGGSNYTSVIALTNSPSWATDKTDEDAHGTITSSVVAGYATSGQRGENGYRYALGTAPTVRLALDKVFKCGAEGGTLPDSLTRLAASHANVVNMSWNTRGDLGGCAYTTDSKTADTHTRDPLLFTVSAGNSPEGCSPTNLVRAPATGKNVIAAGATENYTIG